MKKNLFAILLCFVLMLSVSLSVSAMSVTLLSDGADILTNDEESQLSVQLADFYEKHNAPLYIVITEDGEADGDGDYAEEIYEDFSESFGIENRGGCLLLVDMASRNWELYADGLGNKAINEDGFNYLADNLEPKLSDGDYCGAFSNFIEDCDMLYGMAEDGTPYTEPFNFFMNLIIALAIGFIIAFIVTAVMKGQLKSVRRQPGAKDYMVPGSLKVTEQREMFLYRNVIRTEIPKNNNGGRTVSTSGGATKGGGSF